MKVAMTRDCRRVIEYVPFDIYLSDLVHIERHLLNTHAKTLLSFYKGVDLKKYKDRNVGICFFDKYVFKRKKLPVNRSNIPRLYFDEKFQWLYYHLMDKLLQSDFKYEKLVIVEKMKSAPVVIIDKSIEICWLKGVCKLSFLSAVFDNEMSGYLVEKKKIEDERAKVVTKQPKKVGASKEELLEILKDV